MRTNSLADLLCYEPAGPSQPSKEAFLKAALMRIERGGRVYTRVEGGCLVHYGWLTAAGDATPRHGVRRCWRFPPHSALLTDFYTPPSRAGEAWYADSLPRMLRDAAALDGVEFIYAAVPAGDTPARRAAEAAGFEYQGVRRVRAWL